MKIKNVTMVAVAAGLVAVLGTGVAVAAGERDLRRLAGDSRYATAVEISKEAFPDGAYSVYLARGDSFADALAASSLTDRGPILLVPQCGTVPPEVVAEARRLQPAEVVALGGIGAVCDRVLDQFAGTSTDAAPGADTETIQGTGEVNTEPFRLDGGDYTVAYNFSGDCIYGAYLSRTVDGESEESIATGDGPLQGQTIFYDVAPAEYFIKMIANDPETCAWTITFTSR